MNARSFDRTTAPPFDIRSLLTPAAFPHRVDALELRETHISWLVLTGAFVYKAKKPVRKTEEQQEETAGAAA